jgi:hypothetical protein
MSSTIQFWRSGDWTMVYEDGRLIRAGDHYLADEWLQERVGVTVVDDEAGVCIPDGHHALESLDEVMAAQRALEDRREGAAAKRAEAVRLMEEAAALEQLR